MIVNKTIVVRIVYNKIIGGMEHELLDMIKEDITEEDLYNFIGIIGFLTDEELKLWFNQQNGYIINRDFITLMNKEIEICIEK